MTLVIRTGSELAALSSFIRTSVAEVDPQLPIGLVRPMDDMIGE